MSDLLKDPASQFLITAGLTALGILVALVIFLGQRQRKALTYELLSSTPLLSINDELKGRVQISLDSKPVTDVYLILVKITNSGNKEILPSDFISLLALSFGDKAEVLLAQIAGTKPRNSQASVSIVGDKVQLAPILMNSGDTITVKVLVSQYSKQFMVEGRIVGVKAFNSSDLHTDLAVFMILFGFCSLLYGSGLIYLLYTISSVEARLVNILGLIIYTSCIFICFVFFRLWRRRT